MYNDVTDEERREIARKLRKTLNIYYSPHADPITGRPEKMVDLDEVCDVLDLDADSEGFIYRECILRLADLIDRPICEN